MAAAVQALREGASIGGDQKLRVLSVACLLLATFVFGSAYEAFAFSFGAIQVKSGFGDRFDAEIELKVEGDDVEVALGDEADYKRLEVDRRGIIDRLYIVFPLETRGGRKIIRVVSDVPLFFPSFYLVVRATHYGGTLLKTYLITVDFRQSLALNVQGAKKKAPVPPIEEPLDLLEERAGPAGDGEAGRPEASVSGAGGRAAGPAAPAKSLQAPVTADASLARAPSATVNPETRRRHHTGAIWVSPRPPVRVWFPDDAPVEVAEKRAEDAPEPPEASSVSPQLDGAPQMQAAAEASPAEVGKEPADVANASREARPDLLPKAADSRSEEENGGAGEGSGATLEEGESLFEVAQRLAPEGVDAVRVTVALWMDNQGKFIDGNMNWVREGTRLNLDNLERRLADLDTPLAQKILWSQWQEWKLIRKQRLSPVGAEDNKPIEEKTLPVERMTGKEGVFATARSWARTWEEGDLSGHLENFAAAPESGEGPLAELRLRKERMFKSHTRVQLEALPAALIFRWGRPMLSFSQVFHSERIESFGRKDLEWVREGEAWKIADEKFDLRQYKEKGQEEPQDAPADRPAERRYLDAPYVVHVSTHPDYVSATQAVNLLREKGFDAYSAPVGISGGQSLYRVYLGRFADWGLSREMAAEMRKLSVGRDAIPVLLPYTLEVGRYLDEGPAVERVESLRRQGFSAFLYANSEADFSLPMFRVFAGAFASKGEAAEISEKLAAVEIPFTLVAP